MSRHGRVKPVVITALAVLAVTASMAQRGTPSPSLAPATMARVGTIDERFQSYNIEMLEVTGGNFWKPYTNGSNTAVKPAPSDSRVPAGMNPDLYQYRPPIDLTNIRRRKLAAALGPAYVRVGGTWANTTYFYDANGPVPKSPPKGFNGVLTRQQWKGVIDFAKAVNAKVVTSFATGVGTRSTAGVWTPTEAGKVLAYTGSVGGSIAAAEFMNEPTAASMGGAPKGYDAAAYGLDLSIFRPFVKKTAPNLVILGPGSVGEGGTMVLPGGMLRSEDLLKAAGPVFDAFSYHFYGAISKRCASLGGEAQTTEDAALSDEWLSRTDTVEAFYAALRDRFEPGEPLWITETADSACGGNPWASTFLDTFRYLNQLGSMAQRGVQVVMHNTLDASDYGLLDENTLAPRPDYWAALLWRKLMGTTVLNPGAFSAAGLHVYAHCLREKPGGVTVLVINANRAASQSLDVPLAAERYTITAENLLSKQVQLNGNEVSLGADDAMPPLTAMSTETGNLRFAPASITFLAIPNANNSACQ